ncbi:MAG TPA: hypothetical protein VGE34_04700 [Candidatus Saccharimonadales bacterium]
MPEGTTSMPNVSLRKRQQIENTGRTMFTWVAIASVIVAVAVVVSISLVERLMFNQRVIGTKSQTADNLKNNNSIAEELKANIRERNTNQALVDTPRADGAEPLSVVLDALPAEPNSSALGASLQQKLLNTSGVTIETLTVDPISGVENGGGEGTAVSSDESAGENQISFNFKVTSKSADSIKRVLENLEKSIRVFDIKKVTIEQQAGSINLDVTGVAYYAPGLKVELKEKSCKPSDKACS